MNFKKTQIKQTIEKILLVAQKNNGSIPISNISEASNFFAYLEGYPSWQSYVQENSKNKNISKNHESHNLTSEFKSWEIPRSFNANFNPQFFNDLLCKLDNNPIEKSENVIKEVKGLGKKINLGFKFNKITKYKDIFLLNKENTLLIGNSKIKDSIMNQIKNNRDAFIRVTDKNENAFYIDPIEEIIKTKLIDIILSSGGKESIYEVMWISIVNDIVQNFNKNVSIDFLFGTIDLKFLISYWVKIDDSNLNKKMVKNYLETIGIQLIEKDFIEISGESINKHSQNIQKVKNLLNNLKRGYEIGIFKDTKESIFKCLLEKKSINLFIPYESSEYIFRIYEQILKFHFKNYDQLTRNFNKENFGVWFINQNKNIFSDGFEYRNIFSFRFFNNLSPSQIVYEEQILFCKLESFILPEKDFLIYFYVNTKNMDSNIFQEAGKSLLELNEEEYYLWQKDNLDYNLNKITI